jgi:hypothetical protein
MGIAEDQARLALRLSWAVWASACSIHFVATTKQRKIRDAKEGRFMMNYGGWMNGLAGGGMWIWTLIGVLVVVLLFVLIQKVSTK